MNTSLQPGGSSSTKAALVTGGTSGIGRSLLPELLERGFDVYFIGRDSEKGAFLEKELGASGGPMCRFIQLDLSDVRAVRDFARSFAVEVPKLDRLLNIAGVALPKRKVTTEGFEMTFAVDYLSAYILSRELTPTLAAADSARIVNVAGGPSVILKQRLDFDDLSSAQNYSRLKAMFDAVHAKTVMSQFLAEELKPLGVDVNSFHPGLVKGELSRHTTFPGNLLDYLLAPLRTDKCESGIYASTAEELNGVTGQLIVKTQCRPLQFDEDYMTRLRLSTDAMLKPHLSH